MSLYTMKLSDSVDTMEFNLLEVPIQDKDIEGAVDNVVLSGDIYTDFLWLKKRFTHKWSILCKDEYERLRGFYTRQFSNAEVPIYQLLDAPSPIEESAGSGEYIQITTTDSTAKLASVEMLGNATQTTYSGKNLFPIPETRTLNGITLTHNADGTFNLTGTSTATTEFSVIVPLDQANITFGEQLTLSTTQAILPVRYYIHGSTSTGAWKQTLVGWDNPSLLTKTVAQKTADFDHIKFAINISASGTTVNYTNVKLMVEKGSSATSFEKYVGGTPAPNPQFPSPVNVVSGAQTVKIVGKNLASVELSGTSHGITFTSDGSGLLTIDGTSDAVASLRTARFSNYMNLKAGQTYTLSANNSEKNSSVTLRVTYSSGVILYSGATMNAVNKTFTFTPTVDAVVSVEARIASGTTLNNFTVKPQLELGNQATAFEPYQGQSYEINLGKNLLDVSNVNTGAGSNGLTMTANSDGSLTWAGTTTSTWAILTTYTTVNLKAGTYTLSIDKTLAYRFYVEAVLEDSTTQNMIIEAGQTSKTVTFAKGIKQIRLDLANFTNGQAYNETVKAQLEQSATPTDFAPYFTPIELAKIGNYQDRIYKDSGKWYIEKQVGKVVIDGTETGLAMYATNKFRIPVADIILQTSGAPVTMSNYFVGSSYTAVSAGSADNIMSGYYGAHQIRLHSTKWASLADFTTWLSTHPTTVYYVLATPTTAEITNEALIAQLDALESASLYLGVNNIGTETQNAVPTLALTYFPYYPHEIISPKAVRMELTDGGIINACECRENVQITLRGTIQ